jgi:sugar-specific transcriptional regulator TrmB
MIIKDEFLKKLRAIFDLNIYEVKVWTALLSKGVATASELSDISNIPRSRSYDVLESLEKKGFIMMKIGKPIKYMAIEPNEVISRLKKSMTVRAEKMVEVLENAKESEVYKQIELLHKNGIDNIHPSTLSGAIRGRDNINNQVESMIKGAKESVILMTTGDGFVRKYPILKKVFKKNSKVDFKIIATPTKEAKEIAKNVNFAEIKWSDKINGRFLVTDGKEIMFMVMKDDKVHEEYDTGIWANTPFFADTMSKMFEVVWREI